MRLAWFALALFFVLALVGGAYGVNIDRIGMLIGCIPGMVGLIGLHVCRDDIDKREADARIQRARARSRRRIDAIKEEWTRAERGADFEWHASLK